MDKNEMLFDANKDETNAGPVKCLGITFSSHEERRSYFTEKLNEKLQDPEFRKIEGFPIGTDEDILNLSDPPYYTACPNPWINDFVIHHQPKTEKHDNIVSFSGDLVSEKRHPVFSFHPYHTKVPPEIIKKLIEYYTDEKELILDAFSGSGMTGIAALECGRNAVLIDLSTIATFISSENNTKKNANEVKERFHRIIDESKKAYSWMYQTNNGSRSIEVNYYVWSDVFSCPDCTTEFPFFPYGVIHHGNKVETKKKFNCPNCDAELNVRKINRIITTNEKKKALVWVNGGTGKTKINRPPNEHDLQICDDILKINNVNWYPNTPINENGYTAKLAQLGNKQIKNISQFLSDRNRLIFSDLWKRVLEIEDKSIRNSMISCLTSVYTVISERQGYFGGGGGMSGNLYMPIVRMERNIYQSLERKILKLIDSESSKEKYRGKSIVSTQSSTSLNSIPNNSIDFIYTDPPFGSNIIYSEMNLILEGWLKILTSEDKEAVINESKNKNYNAYGELIRKVFCEYYRVLKPGRWICVEFHNTLASVWNLIQTSLSEAGFVISQVGKLDKGSTTMLADIRPGAVVQDLIISAYKPNGGLEERFQIQAGSEDGAWDFVRTHLLHLPVVIIANNKLKVISERLNYLLYDRMVAFHIQRGALVPISASDFYIGLNQRFPVRDNMYFLPDQVVEYDKKRFTVNGIENVVLFISNESTAVQWLRQLLLEKPQTFQEIHPRFIREISGWNKNEQLIELSRLLSENFIRFDGDNQVPEQIHSYLSSNWKELRNLEKNNLNLIAKAKDRWYVPDPNKAGDLEKLREKSLLKEFAEYKESKKKLKVFRLEAVRAGFKKAWQESDYEIIIKVADLIPSNVLEEDPKLLMWYDQAVTRIGKK